MPRAVVVRGRISDPKHVELEEPLADWRGPVEVTLRDIAAVERPIRRRLLTKEEWLAAFDSWVRAHDPSLPVLPAETLRRESLYEDR